MNTIPEVTASKSHLVTNTTQHPVAQTGVGITATEKRPTRLSTFMRL